MPPRAGAFARWLGPRVRVGAKARLAAVGVAIVCAAVLGLAAFLRPDPRGLGTHEQLGMPPCGFALRTGLPCPTCGMTTAFAEIMHGHPWTAVIVQPAGAALAVATLLGGLLAAFTAASGTMPTVNWNRLGPVRVSMTLALVILGGWAFKLGYGLMMGALPAR